MKKYIIAAGLITLLLSGILTSLLWTEDRTGPIITFASTDFTYAAGESTDILLKNVTAKDAKDGDVTKSIMIADVLPMLDSSTAKVTYVAKDSNDNITREEIIIPYSEDNGKAVMETLSQADAADLSNTNSVTSGESSKATAGNSIGAIPDASGIPVNPTGTTPVTSGAILNFSNNELSDTLETSEDNEEAETGEDSVDLNEAEEPSFYPYITLTTHEVEVERGSDFDVLAFVKDVIDDRDNTFEMRRRIHVLGNYDIKNRGDYVILYYAVDLENHESNKEYLWIKVE